MIFAHFDRDGMLDEHVQHTLSSLSGPQTDITLVSTNLERPCLRADRLVSTLIVRANQGYDFRSWQVGIAALRDPEAYDEIVCLNDSFYIARNQAFLGNIANLSGKSFDVGGLTASSEHCFHIQSYFMVFRRRAVVSAWFKDFWRAVSVTSDRAAAIRNYELRLALQARQAGLRVIALSGPPVMPHIPTAAAAWTSRPKGEGVIATARTLVHSLDRGRQINPTLQTWKSVARRLGIVKVELLRDNPHNTDLAGLSGLMEPECLDLARRHLARLSHASTERVDAVS